MKKIRPRNFPRKHNSLCIENVTVLCYESIYISMYINDKCLYNSFIWQVKSIKVVSKSFKTI